MVYYRYFVYLLFLKSIADVRVWRLIYSTTGVSYSSTCAIVFAEASKYSRSSNCDDRIITQLDLSLYQEGSILYFFTENEIKKVKNGREKIKSENRVRPSKFTGYGIIFELPFCVTKFANRQTGKELSNQTGLPVNEGVSKIELYHCNGEAKVLYISTVKNPNGEWYRKDPNTNNWRSVSIIKNKKPEAVSECIIRKLATEAGCGKSSCTVDISKKEEYSKVPISVLKKDETSYDIYTHSPSEYPEVKYGNTTLMYVDRDGEKYKQISGDNVEKVSVYRWKENDKPLVLKMKGFDKSVTYYQNVSDNNEKWQRVTNNTTEEAPEELLDNTNCKVNNMVVLDLSFDNSLHCSADKKGYCCSLCSKKKINVIEEKFTIPNTRETLTSYLHSPDSKCKVHKIKYKDSKTNNVKIIDLPDLSLPKDHIVQLSVYYCSHNPVLIYVKKGNNSWKWYVKSGESTWKHCDELSGKTPKNTEECETRIRFTKILQEAGCSFTQGKCTSLLHKVKIDISEKPNKAGHSKTYISGPEDVEVFLSQYYGPKDFNKLVHKTPHASFTLTEIKYKSNAINLHWPKEPVTEVNVFFWKHDVDHAKPLLLRIGKIEGEEWYENSSDDKRWTKVEGDLQDNKLVDKLSETNCRVSDAYSFDLSKTSEYTSVCTTIKVEESDDTEKRLGYTRYIHSTPKESFILLDVTNVPSNIILDTLVLPVHGVHRVHVLRPKNSEKPTLLYIETTDKINSQWYGKEEAEHIEL
ncbi:hypothetical protein BEWA_009270 [Theileria equi strain WA]|uniref:Uncharacterized protein n=1 Tax=Theileria equi strain WA TaxID=1537102 RepID=L0B332_THEEQ|nr:hypothetical protein BEWA_009270 [Theileria equi strain WA]AFZ81514.1 hypothetical protein BEWA_009270 [Theileria equi strain WA]|eukprot:XP_004831180.1 hypothetical protein BEWA_009270 [Theileria equi strain WA]